MYDTRWPRPGPAMLAVAVLFGLVIGGVFGFTSGTSAGTGSGNGDVVGTTAAPATTLATTFYTVILASPYSQAEAQRKLGEMRSRGLTDAFIARQSEFRPLNTPFAVCTGQFATEAQQAARLAQVRDLGVGGFARKLTRR
jgi:SPOR domain